MAVTGSMWAVTGSMWLLRVLRGCYGFFVAKSALRCSYGTALREGVTAAELIEKEQTFHSQQSSCSGPGADPGLSNRGDATDYNACVYIRTSHPKREVPYIRPGSRARLRALKF